MKSLLCVGVNDDEDEEYTPQTRKSVQRPP